MPLEAQFPVIDDRTYDDILAEARTRIPRYTPEWTDFNDSDPGMALVQLFAWLSELMIYRMDQVPELNYLKFLELIGIELKAAAPAHAEILFPVTPTNSDPFVIVPLHTQVTAPAPDGGSPLVFETDRAIYALTSSLDQVLSFDGFAFDSLTSLNQDAQSGFQPFGPAPQKDAALFLGFNASAAFPAQIELNLAFTIAPSGGSAVTAGDCSLPETRVFPSANLIWQFWGGSGWFAIDLLKDETVSFQRNGHVYLKTPAKGRMQPALFGGVSTPLYWIRAVLSGAYEKQPEILAVRTNTAPATQAQTASDEVLGGSSGEPNQTFVLANNPVLAGTLQLQVDQGGGFEDWKETQDFFGASPADQVYALDRTTGLIRFGDGAHGAIPIANVNRANNNVVARTYRFGGGKQGNVGAGKLTTLPSSVSGIDANKVTNLFAAFGGANEETLDAAKLRAPRAIKSRCRAVTKEDFEYLAMQASSVARAYAMPLAHPGFPGVQVPGAVTVIIVPDSDDQNPTPSSGMLRTVCAYLNPRRLLTTELFVIAPTYELVSAHAEVIVRNTADLAQVKTAIEAALLTYFHPLRGGDDGQGWPFGGTIFFSRVYQQILQIDGVDRIEQVLITLDGLTYPVCQDVPIPAGTLIYSKESDVVVNYAS
jgi:predicted phage baseplate assembly protein